MQFATINGIAIHHDFDPVGGEEPAIVFINSLGTDFRIWDQVRSKLSDRFSTLVYDKRGHGLSGLGDPPYSISNHVDDLAALLDHLDIGTAVLCGLSVGGLIAMGCYQTRRERIAGLILSNTAPKIDTEDLWASRIASAEAGGLVPMLDDIMARWFTEPFRRPDNAAYQGYRNMLARQPVAGYAGTCAAIGDADFTAVAAGIAIPTLCLAGQEDGSVPAATVKAMADLIEGARYEVIGNSAHIPCVETPAIYAALVRTFVDGLARGRR